jgi:glycerophosphoryl diester phosphodiesterase
VTNAFRALIITVGVILVAWASLGAQPAKPAAKAKQAIAHRGASGYAPEHTPAAYKLAMEQKADFVEPDLAVSKDNILICLHDDTLERTTNIAEVFADRPSKNVRTRQPGKHWLANDFTIAEIKRLDAGKWFKPEFAGQRIQTFQEAIDLVRTKPGTGIYPELKSPELYRARKVDQVKIFVDLVKKNGLDKPEGLRTTPMIIQSFDEEAIRRVATELPAVPRVFLTSKDEDLTEARVRELSKFTTGIAPEKDVLARHPEVVKLAHSLNLTVTCWTFRSDEKTKYASVRDEMSHFLYDLGIDALFTNNRILSDSCSTTRDRKALRGEPAALEDEQTMNARFRSYTRI